MPVTNWNTTIIDGKEYLVIDVAKIRVPLEWDPSSNVFIAVAAPTGGVMNYPALVQGDDGDTPQIDNTINFTALAYNDATPNFASWTETSPNVYRLNLGLHNGSPGAAGTSTLNMASYGTPAYKKILIVNAAANSFQYQTQKVGDRYYPAVISNTPSGNAGYTLCSVPVTAQDFDWRPTVSGQCAITGTGSDVRVDLIARLNNDTAGNIVGRAIGASELDAATHLHPTHVLSAGAPAGSADTYDKVLAGNPATIYLRAERQNGAETFTTSSATTFFRVRVDPVP